MTSTPAPQPVSAAPAGAGRHRRVIGALVVLVMLVAGALVGRALRPATPSLPTAYPVLPASSVVSAL